MSKYKNIEIEVASKQKDIVDLNTLEEFRSTFIGKRGSVSMAMKELGNLDPEDRKKSAEELNVIKDSVINFVKEKTEQLLEQFNLVHLRSLKAGVLSGGEAKRLSLARLMISNPKIVLLDESFSNVDPIQVQEMQKYIMKIQSQNVACILTEHALENLFNTTDRNYLINEGNIIAEGTKRELLNNSDAIKNYFGTNFTNK